MKLYLVAGEASGDARGAELIRALRERRPAWEFYGAGGREMRALVGERLHDWADEAVVGLWDVLKKYGYFRRQFRRMLAELAALRPEALVLIDYPGFNLRLAHAARQALPGLKIIYYISPQVWAWNRGRIPKMARDLDLMLCLFPFEQPLYEKSGLRAVVVGHPLLDSLQARVTGRPREECVVGLFPGSREKEVRKIFPIMLRSMAELRSRQPAARFEAAAASPELARLMEGMIADLGAECVVSLRNSHELMQRAAVGMVASGTATLEAAYFGLPLVILYRVSWLTWVVGKRLVKVPFLGMPNLLAGREIAREFLQDAAEPAAIARELDRLLGNPAARSAARDDLAGVIAKLGERGAAGRAAEAICGLLGD